MTAGFELGWVVGGGSLGNLGRQKALGGKGNQRPGTVAYTCNPSYVVGISSWILV
jgi:hypothetical protein